MAVDLTSHAQFAGETWPFVSLPDFELKAALVRELADVIGIMVLPIVTRENLAKWADFTTTNQSWFWEGMDIQKQIYGLEDDRTFENIHGNLNITGQLIQFSDTGLDDNKKVGEAEDSRYQGPFFPVWQYSPQIPVPVVNSDFRTLPDASNELNAFLQDGANRNVIGPFFEYRDGSGGSGFIDMLLARWRTGGNHYDGGPLSFYYTPIYESHEEGAALVGVVLAFLYWQTYFDDLLPETAKGIITVLENSCGQTMTFNIKGADAHFMGNGDLHDRGYDDMEVSTDYGVFLGRKPDDADDWGCFYRVRVYPSKELQDIYLTRAPLTICFAMLGVFIFTVAVFVTYDRFVEKRQRLVMKTAVQTSEVVSSLFPETVRERLYETEAAKSSASPSKSQFSGGNQKLISSVLRIGGSQPSEVESERLQGFGAPIADEYMHCTVFFADLAGFTKWSSGRTPTEVFTLLETIYGAFDKIARRLGVFKIETIGDCYVAVTGLPMPQPNHAVIMARFAASCIFKMDRLVSQNEMLLALGEDTAELRMRVGMHSGPVTVREELYAISTLSF